MLPAVPFGVAIGVAVGLLGGGGSVLAGQVPQRTLGRAFAVMVVAVAGDLLVSVAVLGGSPGAS